MSPLPIADEGVGVGVDTGVSEVVIFALWWGRGVVVVRGVSLLLCLRWVWS